MLPVLFDTNIYGKIVDDPNKTVIVDAVASSPYTVLNFSVIREELRRTAKAKTYGGGRKLRAALLVTYDQLTARRTPIPLSNDIKRLGNEYFVEYRAMGGNVGKKRIINDLRILACASLHRCHLIVSDDSHLLGSSKAGSVFDERSLRQSIHRHNAY